MIASYVVRNQHFEKQLKLKNSCKFYKTIFNVDIPNKIGYFKRREWISEMRERRRRHIFETNSFVGSTQRFLPPVPRTRVSDSQRDPRIQGILGVAWKRGDPRRQFEKNLTNCGGCRAQAQLIAAREWSRARSPAASNLVRSNMSETGAFLNAVMTGKQNG